MIFRRLMDSDVGQELPHYDAYMITPGGAWDAHASKLKGEGYAYFMVQQMPCPEWHDGPGGSADPERGWMNFLHDNWADLVLVDRAGREALFPHNWFPCQAGAKRLIGWHRWTEQHLVEGAHRVQECCNRYGTKLIPFLDMFFSPAPWMLDEVNGPGWGDFDPEIWLLQWTKLLRFRELLTSPYGHTGSSNVDTPRVLINGERNSRLARLYLENAQNNLERDMNFWHPHIRKELANVLSIDPTWTTTKEIVMGKYRPNLWLAFDPATDTSWPAVNQAYEDLARLDLYWRSMAATDV